MGHNPVEVNLSFCDKFTATFYVLPHFGEDKLRVYLAVPFDQGVSDGGGNELPARVPNLDVITQHDVVDMGCD